MKVSEKRNKEIKIRVTESEHEQLMQRSKNSHLAKWIREHCLNAKIPKARKIPPIDPHLLRQIAGIGNNLNQIARVINTQTKAGTFDKIQLLSQLSVIEDLILDFKKENSHDS
ncbi:MobC family plasmid mobilization relaxosome protein [Vibrio algivorus]|uniref:MobC family plasmid mobilization relaxosome protein n=1 Tax=Vibrio algivorus TaxID=1667024 RepID=A0A557NSS7_9VIBR|nr:MobC family plasmid mobilization relaxosome protein [Vibrio algivorus]TVO31481.1 MobC family plasmid mobilization relaxosome protein [Vibrio algivorus]